MIVKVDESNQSRYNTLFNKASTLLGLSSPISNIRDYFRELPNIITKASETDGEIWQYYAMLPLDEEPFYVNADTRKITIPNNRKQIGVVGDNYAEIVFFKIARYFDTVDFGSTSVMATIEWQKTSGNKNSGVSAAWVKELSLDPDGDVLIGWPIQEEMTEEAGNIEFSLRLVQIDPDNENSLIYSFGTEPATATIGKSLNLYSPEDDTVEIFDSSSIILRRLKSTMAADDSFGVIDPPSWETNINDLANVKSYKDGAFYLDLDENNELSVTINANLTSGNDQNNATYTWQKVDGSNWVNITSSISEGLEGNKHKFTEIGRYRCMVEDVQNGSVRSRTYSKEFYILGPVAPEVKEQENYISKILEVEGEKIKLEVIPKYDKVFYKDDYDANNATQVTFNWIRKEAQNSEEFDEIITKSAKPDIEVNSEGFYFGNAQTIRNNSKPVYSENSSLYRVTKPVQVPTKDQYYFDSVENGGLTNPEGPSGVLGDKIRLLFRDNYKYDYLEYQWYMNASYTGGTYTKVEDANANGKVYAGHPIEYEPKQGARYQVKIIAYRNGDCTIDNLNEETKWDFAHVLPRDSSGNQHFVSIIEP